MMKISLTLFGMAIFTALAASCNDGGKNKGSIVETRTLAEGNSRDLPEERTTTMIRDQPSWEAYWHLLDEGGDLPAVDFSQDMVIAVNMGRQETDEYSVAIDSVYAKDGVYVVYVTETRPRSSYDGFLDALVSPILDDLLTKDTTPYHVIRLPRTDHSIVFKFTTDYEDEDDWRTASRIE